MTKETPRPHSLSVALDRIENAVTRHPSLGIGTERSISTITGGLRCTSEEGAFRFETDLASGDEQSFVDAIDELREEGSRSTSTRPMTGGLAGCQRADLLAGRALVSQSRSSRVLRAADPAARMRSSAPDALWAETSRSSTAVR